MDVERAPGFIPLTGTGKNSPKADEWQRSLWFGKLAMLLFCLSVLGSDQFRDSGGFPFSISERSAGGTDDEVRVRNGNQRPDMVADFLRIVLLRPHSGLVTPSVTMSTSHGFVF